MADLDVVVVGAGFAGIYAVHAFRSAGLTVRAFEAGSGVGGQPEVLRYLNYVADRFKLRPYIQLNTRVAAARWDSGTAEWAVTTDDGITVTARFFVSAVGCLSAYQVPSLPGLSTFEGPWYHASRWPVEGVDFTGKRVGLIGTGSTWIQVAPEIATVAEQLTVFQRTANFAVPNRNASIDQDWELSFKASYRDYREDARRSILGVPITGTGRSALAEPPAERQRTYMKQWRAGGGMPLLGAYTDIMFSRDANDTVAEFIRDRIRETVADPDVAELLCPHSFPVGAKRLCQSDDYYAMFNRENVTLVDLRSTPLESAFPGGLKTSSDSYEVVGRASDVPGARHPGVPNMFIITGPGSPSVLSNMVVSIEQHVEWIRDCVRDLTTGGYTTLEATVAAQDAWMEHVNEVAYSTLFPLADSWYIGANIPGKPRVYTPYVGGCGPYRDRCDAVASAGYDGFVRTIG